MDTLWEDRHPALLARLAGVGGVLFVVATLLPGGLGGPFFDDTLTTPGLLSWVKGHVNGLPAQGFLSAVSSTLAVLVLVAFLSIARGRGLAARIATVSLGGMLAIEWMDAALSFALADAAGRESSDAGVVALFSLAKSMTFVDGFAFGMAVVVISALALRARTLPAPVCWLGLVTGVVHLVSLPVQFALNSRPDGVTGPVSVVLVLVWFLAASIVLLVRPGRVAPSRRTEVAAAA
jgi:hypothetical protein